MKRRWPARFALLVLVAMLTAAPLPAQGPAASSTAVEEDELREAMRDYFQNRLRDELVLTDEQMAEIAPKIERIEQSRAESARSRKATARRLQVGLRQGESDERLQQLLDTLTKIEADQQQTERTTLSEIDALLSVRQRVKLRFFIQGFRRQLQRRVRELQGDRWGPESPPGRRP